MTAIASRETTSSAIAGNGPVLLVATTGGHLEQLRRLAPLLALGEVEWVTHHTDQAASRLAGETVHYVPYVGPRDAWAAATVLPHALRLLRTGRYRAVVTTGAAVAMPFVLVARTLRIPFHYIESATRTSGPSLTGSMVGRVPGVRLYTQHESWSDRRWSYRGSIFDGFEAVPAEPSGPIRNVVVTLGTMRTYAFGRAVRRLAAVLPTVVEPGATILWQVGATPVDGLGLEAHVSVPAADLRAAVESADLVVAHAGIGSALDALDAGICPVLLPRRAGRGEHIDDHQVGIAAHLSQRGLAVATDPDLLTASDLVVTRNRRIVGRTGQKAFHLAT
jgi:UDP-N-acetylglucosamine--N-acetylmuramyl-(pentapeptide) pyrophosphoryl-undecaprenol N-acetylglucosamine transferase